MNQFSTNKPIPPTLNQLSGTFATYGIQLMVEYKRVKNINFRLKPNLLFVSAPLSIDERTLSQFITQRVPWVLRHHNALINKHIKNTHHITQLWGKPHAFDDETHRLQVYRQAMLERITTLQNTWQPIVGKSAHKVLIKQMRTRWGSCNVKAARIWLSTHLAAHPYPCTEYVFVHELCHLHHANHSPEFWACVKKAMPDYLHWHGLLKGQL